MTTELDGIAVSTESLAPDILDQIASSAMSLDQGERDTRANLELLARSGILGLGAPRNHNRALPTMAAVIAELAGHCMSTAFSVWAHRMTIEYLTEAPTGWPRRSRTQRGAARWTWLQRLPARATGSPAHCAGPAISIPIPSW